MSAKPYFLEFAKDAGYNDELVYTLDPIKQKFTVESLVDGRGWIVLDTSDTWIKFAVMRFSYSEGDGSNIRTECLFWGKGPSSNLRECRHTFWGDWEGNGYIFYPDGKIIIAAFKRLSEYFDGMV